MRLLVRDCCGLGRRPEAPGADFRVAELSHLHDSPFALRLYCGFGNRH
jgi:hypothetical protein